MARSTKDHPFTTINVSGAMLPPDLLAKIADLNKNTGKDKIPGLSPESYHLPEGSKLNEAIARSWAVVQAHWKSFQASLEEVGSSNSNAELPIEETASSVREKNIPYSRLATSKSLTSLTNERWLLPLFKELEYGRLTTTEAPEIDEKTYPIKRFYNNSPIHLIGCNLPLDKRTKGAAGAATASPHAMVQEFLNRSDDHLWAFLSNGLQLRILRDNVSLSRQAFVEFDLEAMMNGEIYADFALLWLLCHQSRVEADRQDDCWLEQWSKLAREAGTRVLKDLRAGVQNAIEALGRGFVGHPRNDQLRTKLQESGTLSKDDFYRQLLRIVYRLLFLFVAEDRGLLHPEDADESACELYDNHYSTRRLRDMSDKLRGSKHADLWHTLSLVFARLESEGCPQLGLIGLGSFLWRQDSTTDLLGPAQSGDQQDAVLITNDDLLTAIRALAFVEQDKTRRSVDYRNLGSEELGSVYESLLELHPEINASAKQFDLKTAAGNERKTTGSYYTPDSLVQCLLDSALDPVVKDRLAEAKKISRADANPNSFPDWFTRLSEDQQPKLLANGYSAIAEQALLALKVCDPACGSGHFLIAAAHRLAWHLSRVRTGETEASPVDYQHALRDVISRCIYGVDINPMAVELCKVSLWMEAIDPGRPLSFLDHHVQCGNSLLGTTPALLADGIPDKAFKAIEGDSKDVVKGLKADNKRERKERADQMGQQQTMFGNDPIIKLGNLPASFARLSSSDEFTVTDVAEKEQLYNKLVSGSNYQNARLLADTWCSAFVWKKDETDLGRQCPTEAGFRKVEKSANHSVMPHVIEEVQRIAGQYKFFHWHLAYPDVFVLPDENSTAENEQAGWSRGFDVMLGNPPWERIQVEAAQFFATRKPELVKMKRSDRQKAISELESEEPSLFEEWTGQRRFELSTTQLVKRSNVFPFSTVKNVNSYAVFVELAMLLNATIGRVGMIAQSGVATDDVSKLLFQYMLDTSRLISFYDFVNTEGIFPGIHRTHPHFCLLTIGGEGQSKPAVFSFWNTNHGHLQDESRKFTLDAERLAKLNPNTRTCPVFRSATDGELAAHIYDQLPVVQREAEPSSNPWELSVKRMFDMSYDSNLFESAKTLSGRGGELDEFGEFDIEGERWFKLLESKLIHQFDHRYASFDGDGTPEDSAEELTSDFKESANDSNCPRYWISTKSLNSKLDDDCRREWIVAYRNISNTTNERTAIASVLPLSGMGNSCYTLQFPNKNAACVANFVGAINSFACDWVTRKKLSGTNINAFVFKQLPVVQPESLAQESRWSEFASVASFLSRRVLELTYTAWDLEAFALDCGYGGPPFRWDEERRFMLRCELDAAYFHLYLGAAEAWGADSPELREMFPTPRDAVDYIMETFPIVKRKDIKRTEIKNEEGEVTTEGTFITKDTILAIYDQMATAIETGVPYQTQLNPAPGPPTRAGSEEFLPMAEWDENILDEYRDVIHPGQNVGEEIDTRIIDTDVEDESLSEVSYPNGIDRAICAAALQTVQQAESGLGSFDHLDRTLLACHPEFCAPFLDEDDIERLKELKAETGYPFADKESDSIRWKDCRDYLEQIEAFEIDRDDSSQPISKGKKFADALGTFTESVDELVALASKAFAAIEELRSAPSDANTVQLTVIERMDAIRQQITLAA